MFKRIWLAVLFICTGKTAKQRTLEKLPFLVAEWTVSNMELLLKNHPKEKQMLSGGLYTELHLITKYFPFLLQGKDGKKYLHYLKNPEVLWKDS